MIIPVVERSVTLSGESRKTFVCELCELPFEYDHQRHVVVRENFFSFSLTERSAFAKLRSRAAKKLENALTRELDVVPCPLCGWVQSAMMAYRQRTAFSVLKTLAYISFFGGLGMSGMFWFAGWKDKIADPGYWVFASMFAQFGIFCAIALWLLRRLLLRWTDPNRKLFRNERRFGSTNDEGEPRQ
jgi:hypothetical protein